MATCSQAQWRSQIRGGDLGIVDTEAVPKAVSKSTRARGSVDSKGMLPRKHTHLPKAFPSTGATESKQLEVQEQELVSSDSVSVCFCPKALLCSGARIHAGHQETWGRISWSRFQSCDLGQLTQGLAISGSSFINGDKTLTISFLSSSKGYWEEEGGLRGL